RFQPVVVGHALQGASAPATPKNVPHQGGAMNPSVDALRTAFAGAIVRADVVWGETTVIVDRARVLDVIRVLHDDPGQRYGCLSDVTAVEYRDMERPLEVVWHLRSLPMRRFIRLKVLIEKGKPLAVPSVYAIYRGADWLERECFDMFGIEFTG